MFNFSNRLGIAIVMESRVIYPSHIPSLRWNLIVTVSLYCDSHVSNICSSKYKLLLCLDSEWNSCSRHN